MFIGFDKENGQPLVNLEFKIDDYRELERCFLGNEDMERELNGLFRGYYVHINDLL